MDTNYLYQKYETIKKETINFIPTLAISIFIFIIFIVIANYVRNIIIYAHNSMYRTSETQYKYSRNLIYDEIANLIYYLIVAFGFIFAITNLGVQTTSILTILGTLGLAIGLSLQGTLSNVASGIYLSLMNIFNINDNINIHTLTATKGVSGQVIDFNLFNTTITNGDGSITTIPNSQIQNNILTNYSLSS
jgi:small conductance mechanosensitive channel